MKLMLKTSFLHISLVVVLTLTATSCAEKEAVKIEPPQQNYSPPILKETNISVKNDAVDAISIDSGTREKVFATFTPLFRHDEKKAKMAFGRYYRTMPDTIQFALDLRFKNFEHAIGILPQIKWSVPITLLWKNALAKPNRVIKALCDELKEQSNFPADDLKPSPEALAWTKELSAIKIQADSDFKRNNTRPSKLEEQLADFTCETSSPDYRLWKCIPLNEDQINNLFKDNFFNRLHNMQRRDIRTLKEIFRNPVKVSEYKRYISVETIYKFYLAVKATDHQKQSKYLKRFRTVALDMRKENFLGRYLGDLILEDQEDVTVVERLQRFSILFPLISLVIQFDYELAECALPQNSKSASKD